MRIFALIYRQMMHAKKRTLYRRIIAGVLLAALLPMLLVKTFHYHAAPKADEVVAAIHGLHKAPVAQMLDSSCAICMFVLQAMEAAYFSFLFFASFFLLRPILFRQRILPAFHPLTFLRGPPTL